MKRIKTGLMALALLAAFGTSARTIEEIKKGGTMLVATEGQFAPFNFFVGNQLTGFEIELTELVAKKMGVKLEWKALSFDALLAGLRQGRWDIAVASHGITDERAKAVTFAEPHYCSGGMIVAKDPAIRTIKDLAGKTVSVQTGTSYLDNVKNVPGLKEAKNFPSDTDARSALVAGRSDAWVSDRFVAIEALRKNPGLGLKMGELLFVERIAAAVTKGNTGLAAAWNKALSEVIADGSYATLSKRYFEEDIRCK
ncbi:MAG: amino acid ABC transporter substrate-binding protein [Rhodoferax sp.]|nr:amino acid ABC transporter substrate-binding protein [Rhodoferax sp.]